MNRYASALSRHPVAAHAVGEVAGALLEALEGERADLVVCFISPHFVGATEDVGLALRELLEPRVLIGKTAAAIVGDASEVEEEPAISAWAACLPDATVMPVGLDTLDAYDGTSLIGWPEDIGDAHTLVLLGDPFTFRVDPVLAELSARHPGLQVIGGMASAGRGPGGNRLVLDGATLAEGAVGVLLGGAPRVDTVVSQGCRPVGQPFTVTDAEGQSLRGLGGKPALERLAELARSLPEDERTLLSRNLHLGLVTDEHLSEFHRGDFLVRNVLGATQEDGAIVVGATMEVGQTVQFQLRDAQAADEDLQELIAPRHAAAALLFTCTGRGVRLFGTDDHDAGIVQEILGPIPLAGAFCAGELGPVGGHNYLHGFTASLALFQ